MPSPVALDHFYYINSSNQLVTGLTITARSVGGLVDLFTFSEPNPTDFPGLYVLLAPTGKYDIYVSGVYRPELSPWFHQDPNI